jgi:hypothetical protein
MLLSLVSLWLPSVFNLEAMETTKLIVVKSALFFTGGLVGFACPRRPWRWGVASLIAFALRDLVVKLSASGVVSAGFAGAAAYVAYNCPTYLINALPVLVGAYLSAMTSGAGLSDR